MKKLFAILILVVSVVALTSGISAKDWPCHPYGDIYPCSHRVHAFDYDQWGNRFPCGHVVHYNGDIGPCLHVCYK